ncbi:MAG: hypothetical protein ACFFE8_17035 [Candidatus Heimdallarchaeota archaeon]
MGNDFLLVLLVLLFLPLAVNLDEISSHHHSLMSSTLQFEIIGYIGNHGFMPVPLPPNYTGERPPADILAYPTLVFGLTNNGSISLSILNMTLTQTFNMDEFQWDGYTAKIPPPSSALNPGERYDFLVNHSRGFPRTGGFYLQMETVESETIMAVARFPLEVANLKTWPPAHLSSISPLTLSLFALAITLLLRKEK